MLVVSLLPADVQTEVISGLVIIRLAREGIEEKLRTNPNDPQLLELWRFTYEQEADLLNNATWATIASAKRSTT